MEINELKDKFLRYLVEYRGRTANTRQAYDYDLGQFINYLKAKGIVDINLVTTHQIEDYLFELQVAAVTKARIRSSIASFFNYLSRKGYLEKPNPANNLESIKLPQKSPEYLSEEQYADFIKVIEREATPYYKERDLMIVRLLIKSGLRRAEIVRLNISDVDLSKRCLRVTRKGNRQGFITIHEELAKDLNNYLSIIERDADAPLFMSKRGKRLSEGSVWHLVKMYAKKAGLNAKVTVHTLRHSFATILLAQNISLPQIQTLMGHRSPQTTFRYLHLQNKELIDAFNKVNFERG